MRNVNCAPSPYILHVTCSMAILLLLDVNFQSDVIDNNFFFQIVYLKNWFKWTSIIIAAILVSNKEMVPHQDETYISKMYTPKKLVWYENIDIFMVFDLLQHSKEI